MNRTHYTFIASFAFLASLLSACGDSPSECIIGAADCPCTAENQCADNLVCDPADQVCRAPRTVNLPPIDPAARSCEVLLEDTAARVVGARFEGSVRGEHIRQAPRTAVTFFATADGAIGRNAVRIEVVGSGSFDIARAQCFDRSGNPLAGGGISL